MNKDEYWGAKWGVRLVRADEVNGQRVVTYANVDRHLPCRVFVDTNLVCETFLEWHAIDVHEEWVWRLSETLLW